MAVQLPASSWLLLQFCLPALRPSEEFEDLLQANVGWPESS